jgi:hypothetical protein
MQFTFSFVPFVFGFFFSARGFCCGEDKPFVGVVVVPVVVLGPRVVCVGVREFTEPVSVFVDIFVTLGASDKVAPLAKHNVK